MALPGPVLCECGPIQLPVWQAGQRIETLEALERIHRGKTAALFRVSAAVGAHSTMSTNPGAASASTASASAPTSDVTASPPSSASATSTAKVTVSPEEFTFVKYDAGEIAAIVAETEAAAMEAASRVILDLEEELEDALVAIADQHDAMVDERETLEIGLEKTDIRVAEARLVWVPVA